jgi:hypothetical protein
MDYYNKYLKYKEKYLLAKQKGGGNSGDSIEYWLIKTKLSLDPKDTIHTILQKDIRTYISDAVPPPVVIDENLITNNYNDIRTYISNAVPPPLVIYIDLITNYYNDIIHGCEVFKYYIKYKDSDEAIIEKIPFDLTYIKDTYPSDKTPYTDMHINIGTKFIQSYYKSVNINAIINTYSENSKEALKYLVIKKTTFTSSKKIKYEYYIGKLLEATSKWTLININNIKSDTNPK